MIRRNWFPLMVTAAILIYGPSAARRGGGGEAAPVRPAALAAPALAAPGPGSNAGAVALDAGVCAADEGQSAVTCATRFETGAIVADL